MTDDPFHDDERAAQRLAGVDPGWGGIRPFMIDQHRSLFALLPALFVATAADDGWPLATVLTGEAGFASAPTATELRIAARAAESDPARANIAAGRLVGLLGLDFSTRRRNRANGTIQTADETGFVVVVEESFGNCPKYIRERVVERSAGPGGASKAEIFTDMPRAVRDLIAASDTFFVATAARRELRKGGLDISHRGGWPGFVRIAGNRLSIPDFRGNTYFNTLGNVLGEPRVSLLFVDLREGNVAQLQGRAHVDWTEVGAETPIGAERIWHVDVERGWWRDHALDVRWRDLEMSPATSKTGSWA